MRALVSATVLLLLTLAPSSVAAVTMRLPLAVADQQRAVTAISPTAVLGIPDSLLPSKPDKVRTRSTRRPVTPREPEEEQVDAAPSRLLPEAVSRIFPGLFPLIELQRPAMPAASATRGPVPGAAQLELFGAALEQAAGGRDTRDRATRVQPSQREADGSPRGKRWVPERTLPRVGGQLLGRQVDRRW
jgi:hypothetical protein